MKFRYIALLYLAVYGMTFGFTYWRECRGLTPTCAFVNGVLWPLYWPAKAGIVLFEPGGV